MPLERGIHYMLCWQVEFLAQHAWGGYGLTKDHTLPSNVDAASAEAQRYAFGHIVYQRSSYKVLHLFSISVIRCNAAMLYGLATLDIIIWPTNDCTQRPATAYVH